MVIQHYKVLPSSSLNVSGTTTLSNYTIITRALNLSGAIYGSGTAITNLNYNAILNSPTIVNLNNPTTFLSSLFVSGNTIFQISKCIYSFISINYQW